MRNIKLQVVKIEDNTVTLQSELRQSIIVARDFLERVKVGDTIYLSADSQPLQTTGPKDLLNEIING